MNLLSMSEAERASLLTILWDMSLIGAAVLTKDGKFAAANEAFCRITEYTEYELRERTFQQITHPDDLHADDAQAASVATGELKHYTMRKRYLTKTGRTVWVVLVVYPMEVDGEFRRFVAQVSEVLSLSAPRLETTPPPKPARLPPALALKAIRENWQWLAAGLAGLGVLGGAIVKTLTGAGG